MSYLGFDDFSAIIVSEIEASPYLLDGAVYDYAAPKFTSYPAVVVTANDLTGTFGDSSRIQDLFSFNILCLMNRLNNESQVESTMRKLIDDIIQRLNDNQTINNQTSTFIKPISVKWGYAKAPDPDMRVVSLTVPIEVGQ